MGVSNGELLGPRIGIQSGPLSALVQACPGSEQEGPARSGATATSPAQRGRYLFAHRGKPRWYRGSGAVLEAPALVAGLDDFAVINQPVEERRRHLGIAEDALPFGEGQVGGDDD
jgi:hypothetical protein